MSDQPAPRLAPLPEAQWTDEMREMFTPTIKTFGRVFNIFTTLGRHPRLLKRWMVFANHCLLKSSLVPRHEARFQQAMIGEDHPALQQPRMTAQRGKDVEYPPEGFDRRREHLTHLVGPLGFGKRCKARRRLIGHMVVLV